MYCLSGGGAGQNYNLTFKFEGGVFKLCWGGPARAGLARPAWPGPAREVPLIRAPRGPETLLQVLRWTGGVY